MTGTILALSPHLDDAAFSCGGTLATLADAGQRVVVATVFTRSVPDPQGFALACQLDKGLSAVIDYMALRRAEDESAMRILESEALWLDLPEAPHRGYGSARELFGARHADDKIAETLAPMLRGLIDSLDPALILAPRCVGDHVDHHAVRDALESLRLRVPVAFWTDYPYALRASTIDDPHAIAIPLSAAGIARKVATSTAYKSQIGFQFGGAEKLAHVLGGQPSELFECGADGAAALSALVRAKADA